MRTCCAVSFHETSIRARLQPGRFACNMVALERLSRVAHPARNSPTANIKEAADVLRQLLNQPWDLGISNRSHGNSFPDVLYSYVVAGRFRIHDFVVMRDGVHLLMSVGDGMSIEKALQLIKGNFSYRAKKQLNLRGEISQRGFSEVRVFDRETFLGYRSLHLHSRHSLVRKAKYRCQTRPAAANIERRVQNPRTLQNDRTES